MDRLAGLVPVSPVVGGADTILAHIEILGVVDVLVGASLDSVDDPGFQVDQYGPGDVSRIVTLVVENVLPVATLSREVLEVAVLIDAVLLAELLPKLAPDFIFLVSPAGLHAYGILCNPKESRPRREGNILLLPHWPA